MKALVVDDSVLYRRAIVKALRAIPSVTAVVEASNGKEALRLHEESPANLITLDIEMPVMNGIDAIPHLLKTNPNVCIIMVSSLTPKGAQKTMAALAAGASDFITKEQAFGLSENQKSLLIEEIQSKISNMQSLMQVKVRSTIVSKQKDLVKAPLASGKKALPTAVEIVLVGASTGGPKALRELLKPLKDHRNYIMVIVQHMPPIFTAQLADNLSKYTGYLIQEAAEGMVLAKGDIVMAPGGGHLILYKKSNQWTCHLTQDPPVNSCRPSVDVTFMSVAKQLHSKEAIAMILTGMGEDGAQGCLKLHEKNVPVLTQSKETCVVYGMPRAVDLLNISSAHLAPCFLMAEAEKYMITPRAIRNEH